MLKSGRFWLGAAVTLLFLFFFVRRVDLGEMGSILREANYLFLLPGIGFYFLALWFRTLRWKLILLPLAELSVPRLWPIMIIGYAANNVLPVRLGELVRVYLVGEHAGVSKSSTLGTIAVERVFDGMSLLLLIAAVSPFFSLVGLFQELGERVHIPWLVLTLGLSVPFFALSVVFIALALVPALAERVVARVLRYTPSVVRVRAEPIALSFLTGITVLRSPRLLATILALSIPVWLAEMAMYFVIGIGFGIDSSFSSWGLLAGAMIITTATSNLGTAFPSSGGGIGPFEFFSTETLIILGTGAATASAFAITLHVALMVPVTALGMIYLFSKQLSLFRMVRVSQG